MNKMRSIIMKLAHAIRREEGRTFGRAQEMAWKTYKLLKAMASQGEQAFRYMKSDGTVRDAKGTQDRINTPLFRGPSGYLVRYFDTVANGPRTFHLSNLL